MSQYQLAEALGSSQSRVAKMESSHPAVSLDLLFRGLLTAGVSKHEIARTLSVDKPQKRSALRPRKAG
jgi:transcriptional regulator with XRE-family HTH domain